MRHNNCGYFYKLLIMNKQQYKEKLRAFNATEKYQQELHFLEQLLMPDSKHNILDFGCGTGYAVNHFRSLNLSCYGYDIDNYRDEPNNSIFRSNFEGLKFDKVYFMHSFAHLKSPSAILQNMKRILNPEAMIYIITPNMNWIAWNYDRNYIPDSTVHKHYRPDELHDLVASCGYTPTIYGQFGQNTYNQNERLFLCAKLD